MRAAEHSPRGPFRLLERRHGLAVIGERRAGILVERLRVKRLHPEREVITLAKDALRHGDSFTYQ